MPEERLLMKGNEAIGEAALRAGCRFYAGYPITPQSEGLEHLAKRMPEEGRVFLQAESEIAAINMVYGAACAGVRTMTSTSGPGLALMADGLSYIAGSEVPAVVVNMMRGGPGLGNIQPSQADYFFMTKTAGHGDFHPIVNGGVITHIWLGEQKPDINGLWELTKNICLNTNTAYFAYTIDFIYCPHCRKMFQGSQFSCPQCHSREVKVYSRVTGYYSEVNRYNPGKRAEWESRNRERLFN